jgi:hypothetical protein
VVECLLGKLEALNSKSQYHKKKKKKKGSGKRKLPAPHSEEAMVKSKIHF